MTWKSDDSVKMETCGAYNMRQQWFYFKESKQIRSYAAGANTEICLTLYGTTELMRVCDGSSSQNMHADWFPDQAIAMVIKFDSSFYQCLTWVTNDVSKILSEYNVKAESCSRTNVKNNQLWRYDASSKHIMSFARGFWSASTPAVCVMANKDKGDSKISAHVGDCLQWSNYLFTKKAISGYSDRFNMETQHWYGDGDHAFYHLDRQASNNDVNIHGSRHQGESQRVKFEW